MNESLYIISGCNGAGKTTASYTVLPEILNCKEYVNADEIARGLSPFNPESMAIEAGRLMLQRIEDLLAKDETFAIETTLATKSYINLVRRAQSKGYTVRLLFFVEKTYKKKWIMSNEEFSEKLKAGIELAGKRMLEEKALRGEDLIVSPDGKTIERIPAKQLLLEKS